MSIPRIPGYRIEALIGKGACGAVYAARHESGARIAVKVLKSQCCNPGVIENQLNRLYRTECPVGAVPLEAHSLGKTPILLLASLEADRVEQEIGESYVPRTLQIRLADYLGKPGSWGLILKLAEVLADFHRRRVSHGNLKPGNIFFGGDGQPMLSDFAQGLMPGIRELPYTDALLYAPPEQLSDPESYLEGAGYGWDVHAFGVLAFRLLTGMFPRCDDTFARVAPEPGKSRRRGVEADCRKLAQKLLRSELAAWPEPATSPEDEARREIIERCLQLDPWERFSDMREVLQAIENIGTKRQAVLDEPSEEARLVIESRRKARWRSVAGAGIAATLILGTVATWLVMDRTQQQAVVLRELEQQEGRAMAIRQKAEELVMIEQKKAQEAAIAAARIEEGSDRLRTRFESMGQDLAGVYELSDLVLAWALEGGSSQLPTLEGRTGRLDVLEGMLRQLMTKSADRPELARQRWRIELAIAEVYLAGGKMEEARKQLAAAVESAPATGADVAGRIARARVLICLLASQSEGVRVDPAELAEAREAVERLTPQTGDRERLEAALQLIEARVLKKGGDVPGALEHYRIAFDSMARLCRVEPQNRAMRLWRARGYTEAAEVADGGGVADAALQLHKQTATELMQLLDGDAKDPQLKVELSAALGAISEAALEAGDLDQAKGHAERGARLIEEVIMARAATPPALFQLGGHKSVLGACQHAAGEGDKALVLVNEGISKVEEALQTARGDQYGIFRLSLLKWQKSSLLGFSGDRRGEMKYGQEARQGLSSLLKVDCHYPSHRQVKRALAYLTGDLGLAAQLAGRDGDAVGYFRESAGIWNALASVEKGNDEFREGLDWAKERLTELDALSAVELP